MERVRVTAVVQDRVFVCGLSGRSLQRYLPRKMRKRETKAENYADCSLESTSSTLRLFMASGNEPGRYHGMPRQKCNHIPIPMVLSAAFPCGKDRVVRGSTCNL